MIRLSEKQWNTIVKDGGPTSVPVTLAMRNDGVAVVSFESFYSLEIDQEGRLLCVIDWLPPDGVTEVTAT